MIKALNLVKSVVANKSHLPVLTCVKLSATGGRLNILGTDLSTTVSVDVAYNGDDFEMVTPADVLYRALSQYKGDIVFRGDGKCRSGTSRFTLKTFSLDEFPIARFTPGEFKSIALNHASLLLRCVPKKADSREFMNGVKIKGNRLYATDGYRLAAVDLEDDYGVDVVIPTGAFSLMSRFSGDISFSDNRVFYRAGDVLITSQLCTANAPDYEKLFMDYSNTLVMDNVLFSELLSRAAIFDDFVVMEQDGVVIKVSNKDFNDAIPFISQAGDAMSARKFNIGYLRDCLVGEIRYGDAGQSIFINGVGVRCVIMPVRL